MGEKTAIAWTGTYSADGSLNPGHTFNPWEGCQRVSPGCENCYAETRNKRFSGGVNWGPDGIRRVTSDSNWYQPRKWDAAAKKAGTRAKVFCASLADVFEDRPDLVEPRARLFALIADTPNLDWLLLTKRPQNMVRLAPPEWANGWPANVWAGTTVEDQARANERIPELLKVPSKTRFLSCEPLLEAVDLREWLADRCGHCGNLWDKELDRCPCGAFAADYECSGNAAFDLHWLIIGGESGAGARPFDLAWAVSLVEQCKYTSVKCFVKQMGSCPVNTSSLRIEKALAVYSKAGQINIYGPSGDLAANVWPQIDGRGTWHTWDRQGIGGENATEISVEIALREAVAAVLRAGTHPILYKDRKGGDPEEWVAGLRVREFPEKSNVE